MNKEMTKEEKELRQYMNLILNNLSEGQKLANISIWELAKYLHANPDEKRNRKYCFAFQLQNEFDCWFRKSRYYMEAWESYSKAYFANLCYRIWIQGTNLCLVIKHPILTFQIVTVLYGQEYHNY